MSLMAEDFPPMSKAEEDSKIKALVNTPALDWQQPDSNGYGRGMGGRMVGGRRYGLPQKRPPHGYVLQQKAPPPGYVCRRCNLPGHYIQHCPTNGDPDYDLKRVNPPTAIPRSMYRVATDGSHALPTDDEAVSKPNKVISDDGLGDNIYASLNVLPVQSSNSVPKVSPTKTKSDEDGKIKTLVDAPALDCGILVVDASAVKHAEDELDGFCDELYDIPDILPVPSSKLIPEVLPTMNKADEDSKFKARVDTPTLDLQRQGPHYFRLGGCFRGGMMREHSSGLQQNTPPPGYVCHRCNMPGHLIKHCHTNGDQNYDLKRVRPPTGIFAIIEPDEATFDKEMEGIPSTLSLSGPEIPSSTSSDESKGEQKVSPGNEEETKVHEALSNPAKKFEDVDHHDDASKAVRESVVVKESASQKLALIEAEKRKNKAHLPTNEFEWTTSQWYGAETYMMGGYNPYWNGMEGFVAPLAYGSAMQMMNNYDLGPLDMTMLMPYGNVMAQFPFDINNYMLPVFPPPRENTRHPEFKRKVNSGGKVSSMNLKSKPVQNNIPPSSVGTMYHHDHLEKLSPDQSSSKAQSSRSSKRKSEHYSDNDINYDHDHNYGYFDHDQDHYRRHHHRSESSKRPMTKSTSAVTKAAATTEHKHRADDFSGRNIPEREVAKKRKITTSCSTEPARKLATSTTTYHKDLRESDGGAKRSKMDYRSNNDERRHYNRKLPKAVWEDERRHEHKHRYD